MLVFQSYIFCQNGRVVLLNADGKLVPSSCNFCCNPVGVKWGSVWTECLRMLLKVVPAFWLEDSVDLRFLESTGDCAWALDEKQRIVYWNEAATALFGYTAEEALGSFCYELIAGLSSEKRPYCDKKCEVVTRIQADQIVESVNLIVADKGGEEHVINASTISLPTNQSAQSPQVTVHLAHLLTDLSTTSPPLSLYLFGKMLVRKPDGSLVGGTWWHRVKTRALLAYLALMNGQPVPRETLLDALWPDMDYQSALRNLNTAVYYLRHCLEPGLENGPDSQYIHYENPQYWLQAETPIWLDSHAFEMGLRKAKQDLPPKQKLTLYQDALSYYRGEFLADLNMVVDWHLYEQERLRDLYVVGMEEMALLQENQQEDKIAREIYTKILMLDAFNETAVQGLMRLALKREDRVTAVKHFQQLACALQNELGLRPSPETRQLYNSATQST